MTETFDLSLNIEENGEHLREPYEVVPTKKIKEFIQLLKDECFDFNWYKKLTQREGYIYMCEKIDKLAGKYLI